MRYLHGRDRVVIVIIIDVRISGDDSRVGGVGVCVSNNKLVS